MNVIESFNVLFFKYFFYNLKQLRGNNVDFIKLEKQIKKSRRFLKIYNILWENNNIIFTITFQIDDKTNSIICLYYENNDAV